MNVNVIRGITLVQSIDIVYLDWAFKGIMVGVGIMFT